MTTAGIDCALSALAKASVLSRTSIASRHGLTMSQNDTVTCCDALAPAESLRRLVGPSR